MTIASKLLQINSVKQGIRDALIAKGVDMDSVPLPFTEYADKIALLKGLTTITLAEIPGINDPVAGETPVTSIETDQYTGTVTWNPNHPLFQAEETYAATITLTPKTGYTLMGVPANFFTINGESCSNAVNSGIITKEFYVPLFPFGMGRIAATTTFIVGLKANGTCLFAGNDTQGFNLVKNWVGITQITASINHIVGIKLDGTCIGTGNNTAGQLSISSWINITQIAVGSNHTIGLKSDGTCVAAGSNTYGQCDIGDWADITQISTGNHTVGLKSDGTCVAVGDNGRQQCNVSSWTDIVSISAGNEHTVGLKSDGTCIAVGRNNFGQCNVSGWQDIVQIVGGHNVAIGLKSDGTCVATSIAYNNQIQDWINVIQLSSGPPPIAGLRLDGTCAIAEDDTTHYGQLDIDDWNLGPL